MTARLAIGLTTAALLVAIPVIVLAAALMTSPVPGRDSVAFVFGGALLAGLLVGSLISWRVAASPVDMEGTSAGRRTSFGSSFGLVLAAVGVAFVLQTLLPEIRGWDSRLVFIMFGGGLAIPALPGAIRRLIAQERSPMR